MAKPDTSPADYTTRAALDQEDKNLLAALTAAILATRPDAPAPISEDAKDSAKQYAEIKRVLGTWAEPFPDPSKTGSASKG